MTAAIEKKRKEGVTLPKRLIFEELEREFKTHENAFFSQFDKLSVQDMTDLRRSLEKVSKRTVVVKHTLAKKILERLNLSEAVSFLTGSILVTLGAKEPQAASKALVDFVKTHESVQLKGMILEGKVYEAAFVKELARLPSRKELLTRVVAGLNSPVARFALTLNSIIQSFVIALSEIGKKKASEAFQRGPQA